MPKKSKKQNSRRGRGIGDWFKKIGRAIVNPDTYTQAAKQFIQPAVQLKDAAVEAGRALTDKDVLKRAFTDPKYAVNGVNDWAKKNNVVSNIVGLVAPTDMATRKLLQTGIKTIGYGKAAKFSVARQAHVRRRCF